MDLLARFALSPHGRPSPVFRQCPPSYFIGSMAGGLVERTPPQPPGKTLLQRALDSNGADLAGMSEPALRNSIYQQQHDGASSSSSSLSSSLARRTPALPSIWLLGRFYPADKWAEFYEDYLSRVWCTYRRGFASLGRFHSDSGWGCMIRSGQMMLAEALIRHTIGRAWRLRGADGAFSTQHRPVLRMFLDHAAAGVCPFSIHELVKRGEEKYGKAPGDWYGAELISQVIADVMNGSVDAPGMGKAMGITTHVARGSVVYRDEIDVACSGGGVRVPARSSESAGETGTGVGADAVAAAAVAAAAAVPASWNGQALFLAIPVRLGLNNLDEDYFPEIFEILKFPQSTGIIGGRPGHSLYFVGAVDANTRVPVHTHLDRYGDSFSSRNSSSSSSTSSSSSSSSSVIGGGTTKVDNRNVHLRKTRRKSNPQLVYLDPHYEQVACKLSGSFPDARELQTYHQSQPLAIDIKNVDPGLAFGFYCRSPADLDDLWSRLVSFRAKNQGEPTFHLASSIPAGALGSGLSLSADLCDSDLEASGGVNDFRNGTSRFEAHSHGGVSEGKGEDEWELL